ncbi:MAG: TIGR00341 family protein [Halothermotrichaceae bacterium]
MQIVHATFRSGEGKEAVELLSTLGVDIEDYKLIESRSGDLLIINLLYGNIDVLLDNLTSRFDFEEDEERSLIIFTPDTVIPRNKKKASKADFHASRESLITFAQNKSKITFEYISLVVFSSVITSLGLILDNVAVIVGGMVIAPVLGPILAVTIGIVLGDSKLIKKGISAEIMAIVFAVIVGAVFGMLIPDVEITNSLQVRMYPTMADLFIAMAAGAAGAYALIKGNLESGLVGVMVAASLMPVMSTIGIGISMGYGTMILGASLLLLGNFISLFLTNVIIFYFKGLKPQVWYKVKARRIIRKSLFFIIVAVILLSIPLGALTIYQFYEEKPVDVIKTTIRENFVGEWDYRIVNIEIEGSLINVYLYAEKELKKTMLTAIKQQIQQKLNHEYSINFKVIPIEEYKF